MCFHWFFLKVGVELVILFWQTIQFNKSLLEKEPARTAANKSRIASAGIARSRCDAVSLVLPSQ